MTEIFDAIIVGSGPAGVSAAFPLVRKGLNVLMLDGGRRPVVPPPAAPFVMARANDERQWEWMVGKGFHALKMRETVSPKLRVPTHANVFDGFLQENHVETKDFIAIGSMAPGGLSNAWGCGVAQLNVDELVSYPVSYNDLAQSYREVIERIGVSAPKQDDLSLYFGLDANVQPEIALDVQHRAMYRKYEFARLKLAQQGFRLGRFPMAALSQDKGERQGCNLSGNCLFGCHRRALYSATEDLLALSKYPNFQSRTLVVDDLQKAEDGSWIVQGATLGDSGANVVRARQVFLAAGTIATTRIALNLLKLDTNVRLFSCPTAAFILWLPAFLGAPRVDAFGSSQLAFVVSLRSNVTALGSTFSTTGLPMIEFGRHMPLRRRYAIDLLRSLMSSCVVANMFLPGHLSANQVCRTVDGGLRINGGYHEDVPALLQLAAQKIRRCYAKIGAYMLPMSFTMGRPGGDIHYAGTLPMKERPQLGETSASGELVGMDGVFIVDGACLPSLSEKSHTLTIMANADRIAKEAANRFLAELGN